MKVETRPFHHDRPATTEGKIDSMRKRLSFNQGWKFVRGLIPAAIRPEYPLSELEHWENVALPHSLRLEPCDNPAIETCQDIAMYRKHFPLPSEWEGKPLFLEFEAVMGVTDVYLNGVQLHTPLADHAPDAPGETAHTNYGGYLPFVVDLREAARFDGGDNVLVVVTDNRDNPQVPPGKPQRLLDFTYLGGIYRNVWLECTEPLHITSALHENIPGGGGVSVHYPSVSEESAQVQVKTHLRNEGKAHASVTLRTALYDPEGQEAASEDSVVWLSAGSDLEIRQKLTVSRPQLWDLDHPYLYRLESSVVLGGELADRVETAVGIRTIAVDRSRGLLINGKRAPLLTGVNRHQDFPFVGNAASDSMQRRDALLFKEAGFNVVRAAHYPMSEEFLRACDELGILLFEAAPGWQWYPTNQPEPFSTRVHDNIRQMVRRDRNHPCLLAYEIVLNETYHIPFGYTRASAQIALSEHPAARVSTESYAYNPQPEGSGVDWEADFMYYFETPPRDSAEMEKAGRALVFIREYGDNCIEASGQFRSRRVTRGVTSRFYPGGEARNLQKAAYMLWKDPWNRDTLADKYQLYAENTAFAGGAVWTGIDSRGFGSILSACGLWDTFRLPKFSAWAYMSQRPAEKQYWLEEKGVETGPALFLAGSWEEKCPGLDRAEGDDPKVLGTDAQREIHVYSNLSAVRLSVEKDGRVLWEETHRPLTSSDPDGLDGSGGNNLDYLPHPPFVFHKAPYTPGSVLHAAGYNAAGEKILEKSLASSGKPAKICLKADSRGVPLRAGGNDMLFLRAFVLDAAGNLCPSAQNSIRFRVTRGGASIAGDGDALCGSNPICAEAGIASCLLRSGSHAGSVEVTAEAQGLEPGTITLEILPPLFEEADFTPVRQEKLFPGASKNLCDYPLQREDAFSSNVEICAGGAIYPQSLLSPSGGRQDYLLNGEFCKLFGKLAPTGAEYRIYLDGVLRFCENPRRISELALDLEDTRVLTLESAGGEGKWLSPFLLEGHWTPDETELRVNLAEEKNAIASVNPQDAPAILKKGVWAMWLGGRPEDGPQYWQVDLGSPMDIRNVKANIGGPMGSDSTNFTYRILTSTDGETWTTQAENKRTAWSNGVADYFTAEKVRYLRIEFLEIEGTIPASLTGFEVYPDRGVASVREYNLKGLAAEECSLVFHPSQTEYALPERPSYTLRVLPADPGAHVRINGELVKNPAGCSRISQAVPVTVKAENITIEVTASNGKGKKLYTLFPQNKAGR